MQKLSAHPLARAVRIDKLSLSALAATLLHYVKQEAVTEVPVWRMLSASESQLKERAQALQKAIGTGASIAPGTLGHWRGQSSRRNLAHLAYCA